MFGCKLIFIYYGYQIFIYYGYQITSSFPLSLEFAFDIFNLNIYQNFILFACLGPISSGFGFMGMSRAQVVVLYPPLSPWIPTVWSLN